ncbi:PleD family two-component system response regulator [bacterium]
MPARKIRIALIEDSPTVRMFYKKLFEQAGFEVLEAENAKDGWSIICDQKPDVIVLDMMMPEIPGIELLKRIRSYDYSKNIPVMVLTSIKDPDQVKEIYQQGADHYTLKGMDSPDMVKQTVYQLLKQEQEKQVVRKLEGQESDKAEVDAIDREFFWFESDLE